MFHVEMLAQAGELCLKPACQIRVVGIVKDVVQFVGERQRRFLFDFGWASCFQMSTAALFCCGLPGVLRP